MVSISGEEDGHEQEKIYVAVRVRPLSDREISKQDLSDWECINNTTLIFKNTLQEKSQLPSAYSFDRVFGFNSPTRRVYEEAAKKIALSVLSGINSTIFAYGQTGSGKTFTMRGITECAIADIYDYTQKHHNERKFVLKFSAMEIYNEAVRDLLKSDNTALRLLDDPERGTVVDKLTEVTLKDAHQLRELLSICEAQRQIGETTLNELSSRSHQILRLTVESESLHYMGARSPSTLTATVNFVDLAGSERASQTHSAGTRLKEGCHINRSLLTLGTVIRKLSKGRNGHIPYRDSKLTRILQTSLGGNARTAIICTMSPAHSHVEQSRNTLHFANCAKQVTTNAQVNVVMSEKVLVKQLQKELARLETELKSLRSQSNAGTSASALKEKEQLIQKMDQEMRELAHQRDMAQSRVEDMIRSGNEHQQSRTWSHDGSSWTDEHSMSEASEIMDPLRFDAVSRASHSGRYEGVAAVKIEDQFAENNEDQFLSGSTSPRQYIDKYFGPDPSQGWEKMSQETNRSSRGSSFGSENDRRNSLSRNSLARNLISKNSATTASSPRNRNSLSGASSPRNINSYTAASSPRHINSLPSASSPRNINSLPSASSPRNINSLQSASSPHSINSSQSASSPRYINSFSSTSSPRNRERASGKSLASSDFFDASERTKNCEAILASIMKGAKENDKHPYMETTVQEKLSSKKTLAALLRENSLRISDARSSDYSRQDSGRLSDARSLYFIGDELRDDSPRFYDARTPTKSDALLSRQDSRNSLGGRSFNRDQNIESPRKEYAARQTIESPRREFTTRQTIETPRREFTAKQRQGSVNEDKPVVKPKPVKQIQDSETKTETAEGKTKKEKKSSSPKETAPVKAKKERTISCPEEVAEVKTKKEKKSSAPEENALIKANKERTLSCPEDTSAVKAKDAELSAAEWKAEFERRKREIIELWDACHIPLVHRSYFCLLFKGDPSDAVYMEVEHRRLTFLKAGGKDSKDDVPSSPRALQREREMLSRRMLNKLTTKEREALFQKWGIDVKTKQRRLQLCNKLWTDTKDMEHVNESAAIVGKLAGLKEAGKAPKEMFGLSLVPKQASSKGFSWRHPIPSII